MAQVVSLMMAAKAEVLAAQADTWSRGRSKVNGAGFFVIPASDGNSAHWTSTLGCTCKSFANRGECSHRLACQLLDQRHRAARLASVRAAAVARRVRYDDLYPTEED